MKFSVQASDAHSSARAGELHTGRGSIQTPIFMPVGTQATVKAVTQEDLRNDINAQIILANTYHLYLRPGLDVLESAGGVHRFMNWERPMLTDSGGYQVFSLGAMRKIREEGVSFQSHIDGSKHLFTPEKAIDIQRSIGADIMMAFDECTPYPCDYGYARNSMQLTHRWLDRCMVRMQETSPRYEVEQFLFPIVQGSVYGDLRKESAEYIASKEAYGNAIGGLSVGEPAEQLYEITGQVCEILPVSKPRYLMGVGTPENILECIALGIDMFDCVMPTRNARHGHLFTSEGIINIRNKKWEKDFSPVDENLTPGYSKAYLRHLMHTNEILGMHIASKHNLSFYLWLVAEARNQIIAGNFTTWKFSMVNKLSTRR